MRNIAAVAAGWAFRCVNHLPWAVVALVALWVLDPPTSGLRNGVIYVSTQGADWRLGSTPATAVRTLQRAADMVSPGEHVVILPGAYAGNVRVRRGGEPGRPVVFRAQQPGTVTISDAAPRAWARGLSWADEGGGIHSTTPPWPVYYLRLGDAALFHVSWGGLDNLRKLTAKPGAWPAFAYDRESGRLYVYLPGGRYPSAADLVVHRAIPPPREWGVMRAANVWLEASHLEFDGLRFDFGVAAGLLLWRASDVRVRDCVFEGARNGVSALPQVQVPVRITIENSFYHHYPQYRWLRDWLEWRDLYAHYSDSSLVSISGAGQVIRRNLVTNAGDALQISPRLTTERFGALVEDNAFLWGTDDAIEMDGPARDIRFRGNLVYDFHQNLGLSPVLDGPVVVEGNRFLHPADGVNGSQMKLINDWYDKTRPDSAVIRNVRIAHNTFVGNWLLWTDGSPIRDTVVVANRFAVQRQITPRWPDGVDARDNEITDLPTSGYPDPGSDARWWQAPGLGASTAVAGQRPGPRWLDWAAHPATRDIASRLPLSGWTAAPNPPSRGGVGS